VLNLEWSSSGRDRETASLVCNALRRRGHTVVEESIFQYRAALARHRPKLAYLADPRGSTINYEAAKFARARGFPTVTLTAEGNLAPGLTAERLWGHVRERRLIEDLNLQWSVRARDVALELEPSLAGKLMVAGGVGFDRYRLYDFPTKAEWIKRHGLAYEHAVGYAGSTFDRLDARHPQARTFRDAWGPAATERFARERAGLNATLARVIEENPSVLFVLKQHPGALVRDATEIAGLEQHDNALLLNDEEAISDCIAACDLWMAWDSTTCLEAWLLATPTLLINPTGPDFDRDETHRGSVIVREPRELQQALHELLEAGRLSAFDALASSRDQILRNVIQWTDGKNHLRAAHYLEQLLADSNGTPSLGVRDRIAGAAQSTLFRAAGVVPALPLLRGLAAARARFTAAELEAVTRRCASALERHGSSHELSAAELAELEQINGR
jgi:hypothetical protein